MCTYKRRTALLAVPVALALSGCVVQLPGRTATVTAAPSFAAQVRSHDGYWDDVPDRKIDRLGGLVCDALDADNTVDEIGAVILDSGVPMNAAAGLLFESAEELCPEHYEYVTSG